MSDESLHGTLKRWIVVVCFGVGLAYIEAAVVVYLREIFYGQGFIFPLAEFDVHPKWKTYFLVEVGREAATLVVLFSGAWLIGTNFRRRLAYFLTLFAVWDIFYYVWLKVVLDWPASLLEWDILFLIPVTWAGPVAAPVAISIVMILFGLVILYRECRDIPMRAAKPAIGGFILIGVVLVAQFCYTGFYVTQTDYRAYFSWPLFVVAMAGAISLFTALNLDLRKNWRAPMPGVSGPAKNVVDPSI